jgi:hypothetical protein
MLELDTWPDPFLNVIVPLKPDPPPPLRPIPVTVCPFFEEQLPLGVQLAMHDFVDANAAVAVAPVPPPLLRATVGGTA